MADDIQARGTQADMPGAADAEASGAANGSNVEQALDAAEASLGDLKAQLNDAAIGAASGVGDDDRNLDLLSDVELDVSIELGRTEMLVEDVLRLGQGSVVELDKLAGDPVDVYVNGNMIARGEVLVLNDNFCIRISEIVADLDAEADEALEAAV